MEQIATLVVAIGALIAALVAVYQARAQKMQTVTSAKKNEADISSTSVLAAAEIIDDLREENHRLREDRLDRDKKIRDLRSENLNLQSQLLQSRDRITALETLEEIKTDNEMDCQKN